MRYLNQEKFLCSETGVKVYLKPKYHPALKGTDLSHPDFVRKAAELFGDKHGKVKGLPRICSENSEDAQTWTHFSPLLSMVPQQKGNWLKAFLEESTKRKTKQDSVRTLRHAKLLFWRGKKAEPIYGSPPNLGCPEGNTEVDLTILAEKVIIFVEAKYRSDISMHTTHCPNRDQIIRDVDVGSYYAWNKGLDFYFVLITSSGCRKSRKLLKYYLDNPQEIANRLSHRTDIPKKIEQITHNMGLITWNQIQRIQKK
jgi:hypothetical protein